MIILLSCVIHALAIPALTIRFKPKFLQINCNCGRVQVFVSALNAITSEYTVSREVVIEEAFRLLNWVRFCDYYLNAFSFVFVEL